MKKLLFLIIVITFIIANANAQNVGIGTTTPAGSAQLDVTSTTKGLLPPRMTTSQRNAIVSPLAGLVIYNKDSKGFECYNGTAWYSSVHYIGESYGGGIVFYVYDNGQHGLIAAPEAQSTAMRWYMGGYIATLALTDGIGAGKRNTDIIIAIQGYGDGNTYAARLCREYTGGNFGDWYLPSKFELNLMYLHRVLLGATTGQYWSSNESTNILAWFQSFGFGGQNLIQKQQAFYVRAIRDF